MCDNDRAEKERIAREGGWESYDAAPTVVQNNIDSVVQGPVVEDPFAPLRRGDN
jgi:hypothetical protein